MGPSLLYRPQTSSSASLAVQTLPSTSCDVSPLAFPFHDALPISPTSHDVLTLDSASHSPAITHDVSPFASFSNDILHLPSTSHDNPPLPSGSCSSTLPAISPDSPLPSTSYGTRNFGKPLSARLQKKMSKKRLKYVGRNDDSEVEKLNTQLDSQ
ncbi:hypothetical protein BgiMline_026945, partial [Biomphalaria glabrata]